jgi:hypothetical protein
MSVGGGSNEKEEFILSNGHFNGEFFLFLTSHL